MPFWDSFFHRSTRVRPILLSLCRVTWPKISHKSSVFFHPKMWFESIKALSQPTPLTKQKRQMNAQKHYNRRIFLLCVCLEQMVWKTGLERQSANICKYFVRKKMVDSGHEHWVHIQCVQRIWGKGVEDCLNAKNFSNFQMDRNLFGHHTHFV